MIEEGAQVRNPNTGTEFTILEISETHIVLRYVTPEATGLPDVAEHYHDGWTEEFRMIEGEGRYSMGGKEGVLRTGDTLTMPEMVPHVHPVASGPGRMVMEQRATIPNPTPGAVQNTFGVIFTMMDWAAEGTAALDRVGLPRHPMKFALAGRILGRAGGYDARLPKAVQDAAGATLGRLAEAMGYSVIDPRWR